MQVEKDDGYNGLTKKGRSLHFFQTINDTHLLEDINPRETVHSNVNKNVRKLKGTYGTEHATKLRRRKGPPETAGGAQKRDGAIGGLYLDRKEVSSFGPVLTIAGKARHSGCPTAHKERRINKFKNKINLHAMPSCR